MSGEQFTLGLTYRLVVTGPECCVLVGTAW